MPRKTKESDVKEEVAKKTVKKTPNSSKSTKATKTEKKPKTAKVTKTAKKTTTKKATATAKKDAATPKKATTKKASAATKKTTAKKATATAKKDAATPKKATTKKASAATKKTTTKKATATTKKAATKKKTTATKKAAISNYSPEYYDLPYRYNQTIVKILAQTPNNLFIYWDISDEDRQNLKNKYGEYFFEITKPVLIIHNETKSYSFEIDINDFANSWYLHIDDSDCEYKIELGRRPIPVNYSYIPNYNIEENGPIEQINDSYIYISSSNEIVSPNDKILFNLKNKIYFRNVKTNEIIERDIREFPNIFDSTKFVDIYKLYKDLFEDEILRNPSSANPGSGSFSSRYR